jgi:hypothetical protein
VHVGHALLEADLAAQRDDLLADVLHHLHQLEGADVRMRDVEDFGRRAGLHELFHHLAAEKARVLDLAVELAVGERARAAFAELHVRLGVEHALAPQAPGVAGALAHGLAALEHDGLEAHLREHQRREDAAGAEADDHRPARAFGRVGRRRVAHVGRGLDVRVARMLGEQCGFELRVGQLHVADVDREQVHLACIEAALEDGVGGDRFERDVEGPGDQGDERFRRVVEREFEFGDSQHDGGLWLSSRPRILRAGAL